jgi:hypothetical protein
MSKLEKYVLWNFEIVAKIKMIFLNCTGEFLFTQKHKRAKNNSFSDADRGAICWSL